MIFISATFRIHQEVARKEIEVLSKEGKTVQEIAQQFGMPKSTVQDTLGRAWSTQKFAEIWMKTKNNSKE